MPRTALLVVLSLVGGLLVAGLALPVVGGLGLAAKAAADDVNAVPTYLKQPPLAQQSKLLDDEGRTIATFAGPEDRVLVPNLNAVPVAMQKSIVAVEDNRFYEHNGVDLRSLLRAVKKDSDVGGYAQGASTITEQYVKLAQLENAGSDKQAQADATQKSLQRKITQAREAIALERVLPKDQILLDYLNIAYFGEGAYGIGTAAYHYFQEPVGQLTLAQSALLAGIVNSPDAFDPVKHPAAAKDRRDTVLEAVRKYQLLPDADIDKAEATKLSVHPAPHVTDPCTASVAPFFCAYVEDKLLHDKSFAPNATAAADKLFNGGLVIHSSWDVNAQKAADDAVKSELPNDIRQVASIIVLRPGTGAVEAIAQNRTYGSGPGATKVVYGTGEAYQVGSSFKAITLAAALNEGLPTYTSFNSPYCFVPPDGFPPITDGPTACPNGLTNAGDSENGTFNMVNGTWYSVNTYFVQLEIKAGLPAVADMAAKLGIANPKVKDARNLSMTLGAPESTGISVMDMADVYATLDAHGLHCDPAPFSSIKTNRGVPVSYTKSTCKQVIPAAVADEVTSILQGVLTQRGATGAGKGLADRPSAGKTGTLNDADGAWFVGYTPQQVMAVGMFDPQKPTLSIAAPDRLCGYETGCFGEDTLFGGTIPLAMWHTGMTELTAKEPVVQFADTPAYAPLVGPAAPPAVGGSGSGTDGGDGGNGPTLAPSDGTGSSGGAAPSSGTSSGPTTAAGPTVTPPAAGNGGGNGGGGGKTKPPPKRK